MKIKTNVLFIIFGLVVMLSIAGYNLVNRTFRYVPGTTVRNTLNSAGKKRHYLLHVPASYKAGDSLPMVINFHGYESNAAQQEQITEMSILADSAGFIVVYPEGLGNPQAWQTGPEGLREVDRMFIRDLVQLLEAKLGIDPHRIYATGISNGAQMAIRLGCEMGDMFAAIAIVSGSFPSPESCALLRPIPLVGFHGTADRSLPFNGGGLTGGYLTPARDGASKWAKRNDCAASPEVTYQSGSVTGESWGGCRANADVTFYTIQDGGHTWPGSSTAGSNTAPLYDIATQDVDATQAIWDFFKSHPKP
jgi:polyhydroxybutyrate depolymerase